VGDPFEGVDAAGSSRPTPTVSQKAIWKGLVSASANAFRKPRLSPASTPSLAEDRRASRTAPTAK
jgi:hypothetical protein